MNNELKNQKMKDIARRVAGTLIIPVLVAVVLLVICAVNGKTLIANETAFKNFVLQTAVVMITTMTLSINLNSGRFDFSLGAMAALSSILAAKVSYHFLNGAPGSAVLMLALGILFGVLLGLVSGIFYVTLRIPPIITSLGVTLIYEGISFTITGGRYLMKEVQNASMAAFAGTWHYALLIILGVLAFVYFVFDRSLFGYNYRALRDGQKVATDTGVREVSNALWCYVICGALMGIVGFINAARNTNIQGGALNFGSISIMFTAFLPMFIGGYIGRFSNDKLGYLLAAVTMSLINSAFAVFANQVNASMQSIINGVLLVLFLIYLSNEHRIKSVFRPIRK